MADKKDKLLTAAIDFGTTYSGYAFSFEYDYKVDPLKISTNPNWVAGSRGLVSLKAPTCVLLSPNKEFITFGYEAEDLYAELALDENHIYHYFFKGFKIFIDEKGQLSKSMLIKDDKGNEAPALYVFAQVIRYLKNHLLSALDTKNTTINNEDIHWVLPVPALWTCSAKQFMREAANKAGILTEQLTLCLEPEAASLYCQRIPSTKLIGSPVTRPFLSFSAGTKFMIIDLGGKTVDISIYQKQSNGTYKELHRPTRGPWGGTEVDKAFHLMIIKIFGASCFQKVKDDFKADDLDIHRELETKKRIIKPESNSKITIKLPISLVTTFEEETGEKMKEMIQQTQYAHKMTWHTDKLRMEAGLFKELFREPINMLVEHLQQLMSEDNLSDVSTLLMVGGFSESPIMQDAIMKAFPAKRVIVPVDAGLAVLKGAVLFGHQSNSILESNPPGLL
uniref:Heat shock 70 kDa protein 12B n=1 Tax=Magallana gigas TaxID=29159 RepID=A0A8W8MZS5_MAGGI|nr:heat shock 70 kDa protein 12B [Crassostrea gigas]